MAEMVERVAKAICDYWLEVGFDPSEPNPGVAAAAIRAMLEPTEKMMEHMSQVQITGYRDMIETALEE